MAICSPNFPTCGRLFNPLPRKGERPIRSRNNHNNRTSILSKDDFFSQAAHIRVNEPKTSMNHVRKLLDTAKKKVLKEIASYIIEEGCINIDDYRQWYSYILDIIDTKLYREKKKNPTKKVAKNICKLKFVNKGLEYLNLSKVLNSPEVICHLPEPLKDAEQRVMISYKLKAPIRNKILNYKETVLSISDNPSFLENLSCECASSEFCDTHHGHVITGDLRIIENSQLRSLLMKGPNYREASNINYSKCLDEIENALESCSQELISNNNLEDGSLDNWKNTIVEKIKQKIHQLKRRIPSQRKHVLQNPNVKQYLDNLHEHFVVVTID